MASRRYLRTRRTVRCSPGSDRWLYDEPIRFELLLTLTPARRTGANGKLSDSRLWQLGPYLFDKSLEVITHLLRADLPELRSLPPA